MNKTAELLIKLRKENRLTQNELANKLGVSSQAVSKWERGENLPDSMLLLDISKIYKVTIEELLEGAIKKSLSNEDRNYNSLVMGAAVLILLSFVPTFLFWNQSREVGIMSSATMFAIGMFILLYVGLQSEKRK